MAYPLRYALADLALALSRAAEDVAKIRATAAQAAADMVGDGAGIQLLREDGRYDAITFHHPDDGLRAPYAGLLDREGELPDDDFSTGLAASRRPVVLAGEGTEPLTELFRPPARRRAGRPAGRRPRGRALPGHRRQHLRGLPGGGPGHPRRDLHRGRGRAGPRHRR
ncbi:hypothetical protein ACFQFC_33030 [Amorphoplanes digitatis]|uniref:hypothetical protein n=1 Tax=Actinoplanes digitatis TaxID=1868 RepID=UPI00361027D4